MSDAFTDIEPALRERGISSYRQRPWQLVVSRQTGPTWPNAGNSFWVCRLAGAWHVCTWSPRCYRVPETSSLLDLIEAFVDVGQSAQYSVPPDLVVRFGLTEVDPDALESLMDGQSPDE